MNAYRIQLMVGMSFVVAASYAKTVHTTDITSGSFDWGNATKWATESGPVAVAPTNGEDVVLSDLDPSRAVQTINTGKSDGTSMQNVYGVNPIVGTLSGSFRHTISHAPFYTAHGVPTSGPRYFSVADPSDYLGFFTIGDPLSGLRLMPASGKVSTMRAVDGANRVSVDVPTEGEGVVGSIYNGGAVDKNGIGLLRVDAMPNNTVVYVNEGTLVLGGGASVASILQDAALHLDASDSSTLFTNVITEGRAFVTNWSDVRGSDYALARVHPSPNVGRLGGDPSAPFLCSAKSPTGLPLVEFGSNPSWPAEKQATSVPRCFLQIRDGLKDVSHVFCVVSMPEGVLNCNIVGDSAKQSPFYAGYDAYPYLFSPAHAANDVFQGDLSFNGLKRDYSFSPAEGYAAVNVLSVSTLSSLSENTIDLIGSERQYPARTGGFCLGELLIFTNRLTRAECTAIESYLNGKWRHGNSSDIRSLIVKDGAQIEVPANGSVHVGSVVAGTRLVKSGDGTLVVDYVNQELSRIDVQGGSVRFNTNEPLATAPSEEGPWLWLDATVSQTITAPDGYVSRWADRRSGVSLAATCYYSEGLHRPTVKTSSPKGMSVLDFGSRGGDSYSWLQLPNWGVSSDMIYAAFAVVKPENANTAVEFFGSSASRFYRTGSNHLLTPSSLYQGPCAAHWTINGETVNPLDTNKAATNGYFVVAFSSAQPLRMDAIAKTGSATGGWAAVAGGMQLGEMIVYDRPVSEAEARQVEAYLMNRWLGMKHPAAVGKHVLEEIAFDQETPVEIGGGVDVARISGGNGNVVKSGSGTAVIGSLENDVSSVMVSGGVLKCDLNDFISESVFHFDAADSTSFASVEIDDGVTNVLSWVDSNGKSVMATAVETETATVKPVLTSVVRKDGASRPAVDFGAFAVRGEGGVVEGGPAAAMNMSASFAVKTAYTVFADAHGSNRGWVFGDVEGSSFGRGSTGNLYEGTDNGYKADGTVRSGWNVLDGTYLGSPQNTAVPEGFHILEYCGWNPNSPSSTSNWSGRVSAICNGKNCDMAGGLYVSEQIGFGRVLSEAEKSFVKRYLDEKWMHGRSVFMTNELQSISLANGAEFRTSPRKCLQTGVLEGCGVIRAGRVADVEGICINAADALSGIPLIVEGDLEFASQVTLTIFDDGSRRKVEFIPIVKATAFRNVDFSTWTCDSALMTRYHLVLRDGIIGLARQDRGLILLFR